MPIAAHAYGFPMNICGEIVVAGSTHQHVGAMQGTNARAGRSGHDHVKIIPLPRRRRSFGTAYGLKLVPHQHYGEGTDVRAFQSLLSRLKRSGPHARLVEHSRPPTSSAWSGGGEAAQVNFRVMLILARTTLYPLACVALTTALMT